MSKNIKLTLRLVLLIILVMGLTRCTKENFVEPIDPFKVVQLEPDPADFNIGGGENGIVLKANHDNVVLRHRGSSSTGADSLSVVRIRGSLYVENSKFGDIRLSNGDFNLIAKDAQDYDNNVFTDFKGYAEFHLPEEGIFKYFNVPSMMTMPVGMKKGSDFEGGSFEWPVNPDRYYFYYENPNPFPINISSSSLENIKKMAIDPSDPSFFVQGDLDNTVIGSISDAGIAFSAQGFIPFTPLVNEPEMPMYPFNGNIYISGTIPVMDYPISVSGEAVVKFNSDVDTDENNFFSGKNSDFAVGINGKVNLDDSRLDWLGVEVTLGTATSELAMQSDGTTKFRFIGMREDPSCSVSDFLAQVITTDLDFLDYLSPYQTREIFYGSIGTSLSDWSMGFKMQTYLNLPNFSIDMGHSDFYIDPTQMKFSGEVTIAGFQRVGIRGFVYNNGDFSLNGYTENHFSASWHSLSIHFNMSLNATLAHTSGVVSFEGRVVLHGRISFSIFHASFKLHASISIHSDGYFKVCFSIGIGRLGFDVCLSFHPGVQAGEEYHPELRYTQIPIEQVPVENRFPAEQ